MRLTDTVFVVDDDPSARNGFARLLRTAGYNVWSFSSSAEFLDALERALRCNSWPEIFNTDQGSQYTSASFTGVLKDHDIDISMDGKGRAMDNIMIERLWRSLKYEDIYLKDYETVEELIAGLREYFEYYSNERSHQSFDGRTPAEVCNGILLKGAA